MAHANARLTVHGRCLLVRRGVTGVPAVRPRINPIVLTALDAADFHALPYAARVGAQ
ncbi:leucine zipper domain-containing protein [Streptomyces sp. NPDC096193]|uniref:leucine zipper domain-containing protein n=1 Tax=Streptomyces sp. NPDC096193 TaxID=3155821 RepID=UPI00332FF6F4